MLSLSKGVALRERSIRAARSAWVMGLVALPSVARASGVTGGLSPETMINNICSFILGAFGQSLAILGIIAIGLMWMFGRASLMAVSGVVGGIIIMFGASSLGKMLTGG
ncbi:pilin major subunit VirB2 [Bombella intestini]|uniref:pilin major subunit VirB2 n=1 Tax=Bombella intestini TaxID=1539051 RepID=UPI000987B354|nr:pilin major subunit VirB2 [Bombella intestini]